MKLPTTSPTDFCRAYIERDLKEYHEKKIYMSSWPTMENLITRSIELDGVFTELIEKFGYSDRDSLSENRHSVWLILELTWSSHEFQPEDIIELKKNTHQLSLLNKQIVELCGLLISAYSQQNELLNLTGHSRNEYQDAISALLNAGKNNGRFQSYLEQPLSQLRIQFDGKYWPNKIQLIEAFLQYEKSNNTHPNHYIPDEVLASRSNIVKNFILCFDGHFKDPTNQLPADFSFRNRSMADIINVVLGIPPDNLFSEEAVKTVRARYGK